MPKKNHVSNKRRDMSTEKKKSKSKSTAVLQKSKFKTPVSRPRTKSIRGGQMSIEKSLINQSRRQSGFVQTSHRSLPQPSSSSSSSESEDERPVNRSTKKNTSANRSFNHYLPPSQKRKRAHSAENPYIMIEVAAASVDRWKPLSDETVEFVRNMFDYHMGVMLTKANSEKHAEIEEALEHFKTKLFHKLKVSKAPRMDGLTGDYKNTAKSIKYLEEVLTENTDRLQKLEEEIVAHEQICGDLEEAALNEEQSSDS